VFVANAAARFDADGRLTDAATAQSLQRFVLAFGQWIERLAPTAGALDQAMAQ
jgi:chromate reductase